MTAALNTAGPKWIGKGHATTALRSVSVVLGGAVIALALATGVTDLSASELLGWIAGTLGTTFLVLLGLLVLASLVAWIRLMQRHARSDFWLETGLHASSAIATLALTFTLLGISIGIGTLAHTELTPETVQAVIGTLTEQFSLAFLTSVIGLPLSTGLRAMLLLTDSYLNPMEAPEADPVVLTRHDTAPVDAPEPAEMPEPNAYSEPYTYPEMETPRAGTQSAETPSAEAPSAEAPSVETPSADAPYREADPYRDSSPYFEASNVETPQGASQWEEPKR